MTLTAGVVIAALILPMAVVFCGFPTTFKLERMIPPSHQLDLSQLKARDAVRHGRLLQSSFGVVDFPVSGTFDPFLVGLYYTKVQIGSPPQDFYVQIDTGSDVLWVSCNACNGCPTTSGLQIQLNFYNSATSSSASAVSCSDRRCSLGLDSSDSVCSSQSNQCSYTFQYGDGSGTTGYYVSDLLHLDTILEGSVTTNSTANVMFGCSTVQTGDLIKSDRAVDGIFGFGQQSLSVVSQLASQGVAPKVFSHCLKGDSSGGGIMVLGQIVEPNIVYTALVPSQPHYNLNLQSISVSGRQLDIDSSVFATTANTGTIVDSGTTLAYFPEAVYDVFVSAITGSISQSVRTVISKGNQCYLITSSVNEVFPQVSLNFVDGATMVLNPQDYLLQQNSIGGAAVWCIGIMKISGQGITILGDLFLKDKIFVYDLANQRIGWANYDCSQSVNVSTTTSTGKSEYVNAGQLSDAATQNIPGSKISSFIRVFILITVHFATRFVLFIESNIVYLLQL